MPGHFILAIFCQGVKKHIIKVKSPRARDPELETQIDRHVTDNEQIILGICVRMTEGKHFPPYNVK